MATLNDLWDESKGPDRPPARTYTTDELAAELLKYPKGTPVLALCRERDAQANILVITTKDAAAYNYRVTYEQLVGQIGGEGAKRWAEGAVKWFPADHVLVFGLHPQPSDKRL